MCTPDGVALVFGKWASPPPIKLSAQVLKLPLALFELALESPRRDVKKCVPLDPPTADVDGYEVLAASKEDFVPDGRNLSEHGSVRASQQGAQAERENVCLSRCDTS